MISMQQLMRGAAAAVLAGTLAATPAMAKTFIILDFDGHTENAWSDGSRTYSITVPAYDRANDPGGPDDILRRVAEDFAPFDAEVRTSVPVGLDESSYVAGRDRLIRVAVGGRAGSAGYPGAARGVSTNPALNNTMWVFQFDSSGARRTSQRLAQTVSHELGHAFGFAVASGLSHYNVSHNNTPGLTPILGAEAGPGVRDVWFMHERVLKGYRADDWEPIYGPQDDFKVLTAAIGIRPDDHAGFGTRATPLVEVAIRPNDEHVLQAKGIVELSRGNYASACPPQTPPTARPRPWCSQFNLGQFDDFFSFSVLSAAAERIYARVETIDSSPTDGAGNLAADIRLYVRDPQSGRWSDITSQAAAQPIGLGMELTTLMPQAGVYAVSVSSRGGYSDVGQYTVTVRGVPVREFDGCVFPRPLPVC
jgi:hypothetical protein